MQAFNEKSNGQTLRKFQWGGAVLTADFVDREENLITVKAIETPHPDLIKAFKAFKQYAVNVGAKLHLRRRASSNNRISRRGQNRFLRAYNHRILRNKIQDH